MGIVAAGIVAFAVTNFVAYVTVPNSGVNAIPFVETSADMRTWRCDTGQVARLVSSWNWVVETPSSKPRMFFRAQYNVWEVYP